MNKLICTLLLLSATVVVHAQTLPAQVSASDLSYTELPKQWDEAVPLGNAFVGALVWQKGDHTLRMSLDRIDLWDLRPSDSVVINPKTFDWVFSKVEANQYREVQLKYDVSYERTVAPAKIPGGALEFNIASLGQVQEVRLMLSNALCQVKWKGGATLQTFVHSDKPIGWFVFDRVSDELVPQIIPPTYNEGSQIANSTQGQDLGRLGYTQGAVKKEGNLITYHQKGWGDFWYDVAVRYERVGTKLIGVWTITSAIGGQDTKKVIDEAFSSGVVQDYRSHAKWWNEFWAQSSVRLPEPILQKQYDNDMYKVGALTREKGYIIPLQGVWTADNGKLPPWRGDVHNDLNTQLSYWPVYTGNQLKNGYSFIHTLWNQRQTSIDFTKQFFGLDGINVPGVATLMGEPMGGWIQYAFSPSTASWLSHHFYLHWRYSMDRTYLKEVGYPFVSQAARFVEQFSKIDNQGKRVFPLSSSPEIYDNSIKAWFRTMTNYDLVLAKFVFQAASEMATELGETAQANHWAQLGSQLPDYALHTDHSLAFAKDHPYNQSHRHLSNAMAIHPFSQIDVANGARDRAIVDATIKRIEQFAGDYWVGYSFSWFANMVARSYDGERAVGYLRDFAEYFCTSNTFHANGDQKKAGKSKFTYRPVTLEGNFAFASGVQELLLQSHRGYVEIFPAIPASWSDVSFSTLRAQGAFLVSAERKGGAVVSVVIEPQVDGLLKLRNPFGTTPFEVKGAKIAQEQGPIIEIKATKGKTIRLRPVA